MSEELETVPELLFLKYKGIASPWEILAQAKRFGFKCKKYANWSEVHVSENSRQILKEVGDLLIDSGEFELSSFPEFSQIWEKVQRWAKDKENFAIEPDLLPEYEKFSRVIDVGSKTPNVVDLVINEFKFDSESIAIPDRWIVFLSILIYKFFQSRSRYQCVLEAVPELELAKSNESELIAAAGRLVTALYDFAGFDTSKFSSKDVILLFVGEMGFPADPEVIERVAGATLRSMPKVWLERYEGSQSELVKFHYADGDVFVKLNHANRIFSSTSELSELLSNEQFWMLIGKSIESHVGQIDDIQDFFNTFAKHLRLTD